MYIHNSIEKYLDDLASRSPAPGGGSAAALSAALGCALISMAANFTIGKKGYEEYLKAAQDVLKKSEDLRIKLSGLVDKDVEVYRKYSPDFSAKDNRVREKALKEAAGVPLEICCFSFEAIELCYDFMRKANKNLISDIAVAVELLEAAFQSGLYNVKINLKYINKDMEFVRDTLQMLERQKKRVEELKKKILSFVNSNIEYRNSKQC